MKDYINKILNGDCLEVMKGIPDESVDLVFSDPPYNKKKNYEVYKDNLPKEDYWQWVKAFLTEYKRISNNRMAIFVGSELIKGYWDLMPDAKLIVVRKGAIGTPFKTYYYQYFGLLVTVKPNEQIYDLWTDIKMPGEGYFFREERFSNPGLTSLKLTQRVIRYFSKENDLIFDGFMGTGTTAVAALSLGRKYIGCELNLGYIQITKKRIAEIKRQEDLFQSKEKYKDETKADLQIQLV